MAKDDVMYRGGRRSEVREGTNVDPVQWAARQGGNTPPKYNAYKDEGPNTARKPFVVSKRKR